MSRREHGDPQIEELNVGEASEPEGRGTGECFHLSPITSASSDKYLLIQCLTIRWHQCSTGDVFLHVLYRRNKDLFHIVSSVTAATLCPCFPALGCYAGCFPEVFSCIISVMALQVL